jgi:hypothetical protein
MIQSIISKFTHHPTIYFFLFIIAISGCNERGQLGKLLILEVNTLAKTSQIGVHKFTIQVNSRDCLSLDQVKQIPSVKEMPFEILRSSQIGDTGTHFWIGQSSLYQGKDFETIDLPNQDYFQKSYISVNSQHLKFIEKESDRLNLSTVSLYSKNQHWDQILKGQIQDGIFSIDSGHLPLNLDYLTYLAYHENGSRALYGMTRKGDDMHSFLIDSLAETRLPPITKNIFPRSIYWIGDSVISYLVGDFEKDYSVLRRLEINTYNFTSHKKEIAGKFEWPPIPWVNETNYITHQLFEDGVLIFADQGFFFLNRFGETTCLYRLNPGHKLIVGKAWK